MGLDKIWVFGEANGDAVASITLEMLAAARELADTVEVFMAGDGDDYAEELGEHGAETVYSTGDLDGGLKGVAVAAAVASAIEEGDVDAPDAFLLGTTQDGRDVAARRSAGHVIARVARGSAAAGSAAAEGTPRVSGRRFPLPYCCGSLFLFFLLSSLPPLAPAPMGGEAFPSSASSSIKGVAETALMERMIPISPALRISSCDTRAIRAGTSRT